MSKLALRGQKCELRGKKRQVRTPTWKEMRSDRGQMETREEAGLEDQECKGRQPGLRLEKGRLRGTMARARKGVGTQEVRGK